MTNNEEWEKVRSLFDELQSARETLYSVCAQADEFGKNGAVGISLDFAYAGSIRLNVKSDGLRSAVLADLSEQQAAYENICTSLEKEIAALLEGVEKAAS